MRTHLVERTILQDATQRTCGSSEWRGDHLVELYPRNQRSDTNVPSGADVIRTLRYAEAIGEAIAQEFARDSSLVVFRMNMGDSKVILGTSECLAGPFGAKCPDSLQDVLAEGSDCEHESSRIPPEFLTSSADRANNIAMKVREGNEGTPIPLLIRAIRTTSRRPGPRQSLRLDAHLLPAAGLKIVAPMTPFDAKGMLIRAIRDPHPMLFVEHNAIRDYTGAVPERPYTVPVGKARLLAEGAEITLVGISNMTVECLRARELLQTAGISSEVIDILSITPLDVRTIAASVRTTGRLLVVDHGWTDFGVGEALLALVGRRFQGRQAVALHQIGESPDSHSATGNPPPPLYADASMIASRAYAIVTRDPSPWIPARVSGPPALDFRGPF